MKRVNLTPRGPEFSRIVYGTWRVLDAKLSAQEINRRLHACVDVGITTIDTAEIYGRYEVEEQLGAALALSPGLRVKLEFVTKAGIYVPNEKQPHRRTSHYDANGAAIGRKSQQIAAAVGSGSCGAVPRSSAGLADASR